MQITAGIISYDNTDIQSAITTYYANYRTLMDAISETKLPPELYIQPMIMAPPGQDPAFIIQFVWAGPPSDESQNWLDSIVGLAPGGSPAVNSLKPADYTRELTKLIDLHIQGGDTCTVSIRSLVPSQQIVDIIAKNASLVTPEWGAIFVHMIHGQSVTPQDDRPASVFASRESHLMVEMLGFSYKDPNEVPAASAWCKTMAGEMNAADGLLAERYFSLTHKATLDLTTTFKKDALDFLKQLKKELDPDNVFRYPMPLGE